MINIHNHTKYSPHGFGEISEYLKVAKAKGITIFGFSEHFPLPRGYKDPSPKKNNGAMAFDNLTQYINDVLAAKKKDSNILLGTEIDWIEGYEDAIKEELGKHDFDYIIGSVHFMRNWALDWDVIKFGRGIKEIWSGSMDRFIDAYFRLLQQMINADIIDIVAHIDLIKKFNVNNKFFSENNPVFTKGIEETLKLIKKKDILVEVNTGGIDKPIGEMFPSPAIVKRCHELGIKMTLGSDSHKPEEVGRYFDKAIAMLKAEGYTHLHYVKERKIREFKI